MRKLLLTMALAASTLTMSAGEGWPANYSGVMLQGFWWDSYTESQWTALTQRANELSTYFDLIWIPNAGTTSTGKYDIEHGASIRPSMGYDPCFWLEYNTCFGTEQELLTMIDTYQQLGTGIIEDVVINHKNGDSGWCHFPDEVATGRKTGKAYTLTWDNTNYTGICCDDEANYNNDSGVAGQITGNKDTGTGFDGYRDLDHTNELVQQNIMTYQDYLLNEVGFAGFRLDMVKGYNPCYTGIYNTHSNPQFSVGEFWDANKDYVAWWIKETGYTSAAFDFPLKYTINDFLGGKWDALSNKSITANPSLNRYSVTFAENHDTFREESCPLPSSWSAANAFILAMPGTPCVFFKHYEVDKTNIQAMILARKACGLHNQSAILQQYQYGKYGNGYVIETQGTTGRIYLQLGDATGQAAPDGYELVASSANEVPYKFYKNENAPEAPTYMATIHNDEEISVFYETDASSVSIWAWNGDNNYTGGVWDKKPNMELMGKAWNGNNIFKWVYASDNQGMPNKVIFVPEGKNQSADLEFVNHGFYLEGTGYSSTITATREGNYTVYFDASNTNWNNVHAYVWQGGSGVYQTPWPGQEVQATADGLYTYTFDGKYDRIIFNNGEGQPQTPDYNVIQGHIYNASFDTNHTRMDLADKTAITPSLGTTYQTFNYTRNYNGQWQALYIPFALPYAAWGNDFQIAEPTSCDGEMMKIRKLTAGEATQPNGIYFIKANEAGDKTLQLRNVSIEVPKTETALDVSGYTFYGTSTGVTRGEWNANWYAMGNSGALAPTNVSPSELVGDAILLQAQRWYLIAPAGAPARLRLGEETEGIETIVSESDTATPCYNLQGQPVPFGSKGFVIINGKKCVIK